MTVYFYRKCKNISKSTKLSFFLTQHQYKIDIVYVPNFDIYIGDKRNIVDSR